MAALLLGGVLAVAGLAWVLLPILRGVPAVTAATPAGPVDAGATALETLREIEFDHATGKLAAEDYATLRAEFAPRAVEELRARGALVAESAGAPAGGSGTSSSSSATDPAEQLITRAKSRARACAQCGPRPESDALFCSDCGRYLAAACLRCGAKVDAERARFCTECGGTLAA